MSSSSAATAGGSTSTISAKTASGFQVIKVKGYSKQKAAGGPGTTVVVPYGVLVVGGHSWRIQYFPCAGWVCFSLHLVNSDYSTTPVKARFEFRLLDSVPPLLSTRTYASRLTDFSSAHTQEHLCLVRRDIVDSVYGKAGCFSVKCDVTVLLETRNGSVQPSPDLHRHLGNMLATGVGGDVTFVVDEEEFVAHKSVLAARSPVFMAEFFGGMMEEKAAADAHVRILGIDARVFKTLMHFIYTDSLSGIHDDEGDDEKIFMAQHLLVAADRYGVERLKSICENKLCNFVNASVVVTTLVLAEQHGCRRLTKACFRLLKSLDNFKALGYDDYNYLMRSWPSLLDRLLAKHGL